MVDFEGDMPCVSVEGSAGVADPAGEHDVEARGSQNSVSRCICTTEVVGSQASPQEDGECHVQSFDGTQSSSTSESSAHNGFREGSTATAAGFTGEHMAAALGVQPETVGAQTNPLEGASNVSHFQESPAPQAEVVNNSLLPVETTPWDPIPFYLGRVRVLLPRSLLESEALQDSFLRRLIILWESGETRRGNGHLNSRGETLCKRPNFIRLEARDVEGFSLLVSHIKGDDPLRLCSPASVIPTVCRLLASCQFWGVKAGSLRLPHLLWVDGAWVGDIGGVYPLNAQDMRALCPIPWNERHCPALRRLQPCQCPSTQLAPYMAQTVKDDFQWTSSGSAFPSPPSTAAAQETAAVNSSDELENSAERWLQLLPAHLPQSPSRPSVVEKNFGVAIAAAATAAANRLADFAMGLKTKSRRESPGAADSRSGETAPLTWPSSFQRDERQAASGANCAAGSQRVGLSVKGGRGDEADAVASGTGDEAVQSKGVHGDSLDHNDCSLDSGESSLPRRRFSFFSEPPFSLGVDRLAGRLLLGLEGAPYPFVVSGSGVSSLQIQNPTAFRVGRLRWFLLLNPTTYLDVHLSSVPWHVIDLQKQEQVRQVRRFCILEGLSAVDSDAEVQEGVRRQSPRQSSSRHAGRRFQRLQPLSTETPPSTNRGPSQPAALVHPRKAWTEGELKGRPEEGRPWSVELSPAAALTEDLGKKFQSSVSLSAADSSSSGALLQGPRAPQSIEEQAVKAAKALGRNGRDSALLLDGRREGASGLLPWQLPGKEDSLKPQRILHCSVTRSSPPLEAKSICVHPCGQIVAPLWPLTAVCPKSSSYQTPVVTISSGLFARQVKEVVFYPWGSFALFGDRITSRVFGPDGLVLGYSLVIGKITVFGQTIRDWLEKRVILYARECKIQQDYVASTASRKNPLKEAPARLLAASSELKFAPYVDLQGLQECRAKCLSRGEKISMRDYYTNLRLSVSAWGRVWSVSTTEKDFTIGVCTYTNGSDMTCQPFFPEGRNGSAPNTIEDPAKSVLCLSLEAIPGMTNDLDDVVKGGFPDGDKLYNSQMIGYFDAQQGSYFKLPLGHAYWMLNV